MIMKIVIGMTGASGVVYGVKLIEFLSKKVETVVIVSKTAEKIIAILKRTGAKAG
ncbi:hypothetical protein J7J18_02475, partial [bacterium]|nr:hypothetical protein [bacterium]